MEFSRARWEEHPDERLLARHEREVVPLLHRRAQFADVDRFRLYDVRGEDGAVLEDVYAYSNHVAGAGSLVVVNLRYPQASGVLRESAPFRWSGQDALRQESLGQALGLQGGVDRFTVLHEHVSGRTYLQRSDQLRADGLWVRLDGYGRQVFLDVHERVDYDGRLARLHEQLAGEGVASLEDALEELRLEGVHDAFMALVAADASDRESVAAGWSRFVAAGPVTTAAALEPLPSGALARVERALGPVVARLAWALHALSHAAWPQEAWRTFRLGRASTRYLAKAHGAAVPSVVGQVALHAWTVTGQGWQQGAQPPEPLAWLRAALGAPGAAEALGINDHDGVRWFRRESALRLADVTTGLLRLSRAGGAAAASAAAWRRRVERLVGASGYRVEDVMAPSAAVCAAATDAGGRRGGSAKRRRVDDASRRKKRVTAAAKRRGRPRGGRSSG